MILRMLRESGLMPDLEQYAKGTDGRVMHLYGDPAYPLTQYIMSPRVPMFSSVQVQTCSVQMRDSMFSSSSVQMV